MVGVNGKVARALHDHSPVIRTALSYACDETGQGTPEFYDRLAGGTLEKVIKVLPRRNSWELNNAATDWPETHRSAEGDSRTPGVKMDEEVRTGKFGYLVVYEKQPDGRWAYTGPYNWDRLYVDPVVFPPARTFEADDEQRLGKERYRWGVCLIATSPDLTAAEKEKRLKGRPDGLRLVREEKCPGREELINEMVVKRATATLPANRLSGFRESPWDLRPVGHLEHDCRASFPHRGAMKSCSPSAIERILQFRAEGVLIAEPRSRRRWLSTA